VAAKVRPALVLSVPPDDVDRALVTLVPHTTSLRGSRCEVPTKLSFLKPGGFDAQGLVTVPFVRLVRPIAPVDLNWCR
jgi:mRNA interferase MazF